MNNTEMILKLLKDSSYQGDCLEQEHLHWALRVGSISYQYKELLRWLRKQLLMPGVRCKELEYMFENLEKSFLNRTTRPISEWLIRRNTVENLLQHVLVAQSAAKSALDKIFNGNGNADTKERDYEEPKMASNKESIVKKNLENSANSAKGNRQRFAILNYECPFGHMTGKDWKTFRKELYQEFRKCHYVPHNFSFKEFDILMFDQSAANTDCLKMIRCPKAISLNMLQRMISAVIKRQSNKSLYVILDKKLDDYFIFTAWVWIPYGTPKLQIVKKIACDNTKVDTSDWDVLKTGKQDGGGQHYLLKLCHKSVAQLNRHGCLKFGDETLTLRLNKKLGRWVNFRELEMGDYACNDN